MMKRSDQRFPNHRPETIAHMIKQADVPKEYWDVKLSDWEIRNPTWEKYHDVIERYAEEFTLTDYPAKGLWFCGESGLGKTMLSSFVIKSAIEAGWRCQFVRARGYYDSLLEQLRMEKRISVGVSQEFLAEYDALSEHIHGIRAHATLLVVDDLGKEHRTATGFAEEKFDYIVRYRYDKGLPTVVSTNTALDKVGGVYGESFFSFIHQAFTIISLEGEDYRLEGG